MTMAWYTRRGLFVLLAAAALVFQSGMPDQLLAQDATPAASPTAAGVALAASGVPNPRGFLWDANGAMLVASGGIGGTAVLPADASGAVFRIEVENGCPVTLASGFPSASAFGGRYGISDVAILNGTLYALGDGGFDVQPPTPAPDGVYRIDPDGSWQAIANVGAWVEGNPTKLVPSDSDPGGEPYAMISDGQDLWVSESNHGQLLRVTPQGAISRIVDLSDPHLVPTGLKPAPDGGVYVGFLTAAPFTDGSSKVVKITADGKVTEVWTGLTAVTDVAVAPDGTLYALEMSTDNAKEPPFYRRNAGRVVRQTGPSSLEPVLSGLDQPVRMGFGPDGGLYVALPAHDAELKPGAILRVDPAANNLTLPAGLLASGHCTAFAATPAATPTTALPTSVPAGAGAGPAATVTTTTGAAGAGPVTIDITIHVDVGQPGGSVTLPVTVGPGMTPVVGPAAPAAPAGRISPESPTLGREATASSQGAPAAAAGTAIKLVNMAFDPATVTIPAGTKITWTNTDPVAHTATAVGGAFNSGNLAPGQSFTFTFDKAGTFDYHCLYHPYMKGTIIVK
jgi:plastocyanin